MALPKTIRKCWLERSDLTIYDATFWMLFESDPEQHAFRCEYDLEFAFNFSDNPNGEEAVYEKSQVIQSAIRAKKIETTNVNLNGNFLDITKTFISKSDWIEWCQQHEYAGLCSLFTQHINVITSSLPNTKPLDATVSASAILTSLITKTPVGIKSTYKPRNAVGKLAVKASEIIEQEMMKRASAKQVMERLQKWADEGSEPSTLKNSIKNKQSVIWLTEKGKELPHSLEACGKTLEKWNKGRH